MDDVPLRDLRIISDAEVTGTLPGGVAGTKSILVKKRGLDFLYPGGIEVTDDFLIVRVDPLEGSVAGNTLVSVLGRGLTLPESIVFGTSPGEETKLENSGLLSVRTPPASTGTVSVSAEFDSASWVHQTSYRYFSPQVIGGGAWGGPIEGAVNVAVQTLAGAPLSGMTVQLGTEAGPSVSASERRKWIGDDQCAGNSRGADHHCGRAGVRVCHLR